MSSLSLNNIFKIRRLGIRLKDMKKLMSTAVQTTAKEVLFGELNKVSIDLANSCNEALKKAEVQLGDAEEQTTASLCRANDDLTNLREIVSSLSEERTRFFKTSVSFHS